jgi:hypothetical protein
MIRATIDPGSAVVAVLIYDDDAPGYVARYVDARTFTVGRLVPRDVPKVITPKPRTLPDGSTVTPEPYTLTERREVTEADERAVSVDVVAFLLSHGVGEVTIERVSQPFGANLAAAISQGGQLVKTKGVATWIAARCDALGIVLGASVLATSWRARLAPLVREHAVPIVAGPAIRDEGASLVPVLAALIQDWPKRGTFTDKQTNHIRVVGGMALWSLLPLLPGAKRKADGPRRPRNVGGVKRTPKGGKGGRYPRGARDRAKMSETERERSRGVDRARYARTKGAVVTECNCKPAGAAKRGRHKRTCPEHKGPPPTCRVCYRPFSAHSRPCAA